MTKSRNRIRRYNKNKDSLPIYLRSESLFFVMWLYTVERYRVSFQRSEIVLHTEPPAMRVRIDCACVWVKEEQLPQ